MLQPAGRSRRPSPPVGVILIWVVSAIVLIYAVAGGLEAAFYTDMIQGIFIIILSIIFIPFGLSRINETYGGASGAAAISFPWHIPRGPCAQSNPVKHTFGREHSVCTAEP